MARSFCIPGIIILALALACAILASISLPFLPALEVVRTHFSGNLSPQGSSEAINEVRVRLYRALMSLYYCSSESGTHSLILERAGYAYSLIVNGQNGSSIKINTSWTRGLVITPVAAAVTFIAFLLSFSEHLTITLVASLMSFLAAFLMLIAFICDIALFAWTQAKMHDLDGVSAKSYTGAGFWLTFASFILLLFAGCTVCFGRRRDMRQGANSYPLKTGGFLSRFRR
ncbi:hypothetical protein EXIGLDRAFT_586293, partial [Exidia glandulosa HHB12029]